MEMCLTLTLFRSNALFQNLLGFFDILSMKIYGIRSNSPLGIVLSKDELGRLSIVLVHQLSMSSALLRVFMCGRTISAFVGCMSLLGEALLY